MIDDNVRMLMAMRAKRHDECPCHEMAFNEDDFARIFGAGDELQQKPSRIDQVQFDHGCRDGDYA